MVCLVEPLSDACTGSASTGVDHLYSVAAVTDDAGVVAERYGYDSYGDRVALDVAGASTSTTPLTDYGFTGRRLDGETGLWYFRARYFDPESGRFVSRDFSAEHDPRLESDVSRWTGYHDGLSLYAGYFLPNQTDSSGHYADDGPVEKLCRHPGPGSYCVYEVGFLDPTETFGGASPAMPTNSIIICVDCPASGICPTGGSNLIKGEVTYDSGTDSGNVEFILKKNCGTCPRNGQHGWMRRDPARRRAGEWDFGPIP